MDTDHTARKWLSSAFLGRGERRRRRLGRGLSIWATAMVQMKEREAEGLQGAMSSPRTGLGSAGTRIIWLHQNVKLQPGP